MLSLIVAISDNGVIGRNNDLPWHLSSDLKRFRALTTGHTIIMGRRTWESIGRPLPERRSIVVTRRDHYAAEGAEVVHSLDDAITLAVGDDEVFVIGGAALFEEAMPRADRLYLTRVHAHVEGDVFLTLPNLSHWQLLQQRRHDADQRDDYAVTFEVYERAAGREATT